MGSVCCVPAAAKANDLNRTEGGTFHRSARCSPTWSFRWENQRRVAGEFDDSSSYQMSRGFCRDVSAESKGALGNDRGSCESFRTPVCMGSPIHEGMDANLATQPSDLSMGSNYLAEVKSMTDSPDIANLSASKTYSSFSTPVAVPLPTHDQPVLPSSTPSRRARRSPGHRLLRQISDSRIMGFKSPNSCSLSEGRPSFVLSTCSRDLAMGSHVESSDSWSMRTFSELVVSSQRERWSFDSEHLSSGFGKISGCSSRFSNSPSLDLQACGACSKFITERAPWSSQRIIASNELSVVAVLVCGHVYHAECLESMTLEVDKYDPACPICMEGEKQVSKMSKKALRAEAELKAKSHKISRNRVVDSSFDSNSDDSFCQTYAVIREGPNIEPSSAAACSSTKPFLRHFSFGSKWSRSLSENNSARRKGFWTRYLKH